MFRMISTTVALLSLSHGAIVHAANKEKCLNEEQAEALVTYLLPKAVEASRQQCATALPITASLLMENSEQLARYNAASETAWPQARAAVNVIAGGELPAELDDKLVRSISDAMFTQMISGEIKPDDCATIDKIYTDLEPMPSANLASLAVTILQAATKNDEKPDIPICKQTS